MWNMRRIRGPEAHAARMALIEGRFPPGMQVRCSKCGEIRAVEEGAFIRVNMSGTGPTQAFRCVDCSEAA